MKIVYRGRLDGDFEGFDDEVLFKTMSGTYWIQDEYKYWYHYAYNPEVVITEQNGKHLLTVAGKSVRVRRIDAVIESRIEGEFTGWAGESAYRLANGQVWKQSSYKYEYKYEYMPEATVYEAGSGHKMQVSGTTADVRRVR